MRNKLCECVELYLKGSLEAEVSNDALVRQYHQTVLDNGLQKLQTTNANQQQQAQQEDPDTPNKNSKRKRIISYIAQ
jgi:hypothetical protein